MIAWIRAVLSIGLIAAGAGLGSRAAAAPDLLAQLRAGGLVIYFRHARTDWSQSSRETSGAVVREGFAQPGLMRDCTLQRNLSPEGRNQARLIGEAFRQLAIPVSRLVSSPFCRCIEHARLAFGREPEISADVFDAIHLPRERRASAARALETLLSTPVPAGGNVVIVAHRPNLLDLTRVSLAEGEAAIIRSTGERFEIIGRIEAEAWSKTGGSNP